MVVSWEVAAVDLEVEEGMGMAAAGRAAHWEEVSVVCVVDEAVSVRLVAEAAMVPELAVSAETAEEAQEAEAAWAGWEVEQMAGSLALQRICLSSDSTRTDAAFHNEASGRCAP